MWVVFMLIEFFEKNEIPYCNYKHLNNIFCFKADLTPRSHALVVSSIFMRGTRRPKCPLRPMQIIPPAGVTKYERRSRIII